MSDIKIDSIISMVKKIDNRLDTIENEILKSWKAEDKINNKSTWPFDEAGNLLPNINITNKNVQSN
jgi:hypothetical protein